MYICCCCGTRSDNHLICDNCRKTAAPKLSMLNRDQTHVFFACVFGFIEENRTKIDKLEIVVDSTNSSYGRNYTILQVIYHGESFQRYDATSIKFYIRHESFESVVGMALVIIDYARSFDVDTSFWPGSVCSVCGETSNVENIHGFNACRSCINIGHDQIVKRIQEEELAAADLLPKATKTYNYVFHGIDTDMYKLGITYNPEIRRKQVESPGPYALEITHSIKMDSEFATADMERFLHKHFHAYRKKGEWFKLNEKQVQECIKIMNTRDYKKAIKNNITNWE